MVASAVLDTNVLVSALLTPHGKPASLLALVLAGRVVPCYDGRILAEYAEVLARPKFELDPRTARAIVERIRRNGIAVLPAPLAVRLPDPDGVPSAEVSQAADVPLVTGNLKHFPKFERAIGVAEFLLALAD